MIVDIALGIVLAVIILRVLPLIVGAGAVAIVIGVIALALYLLFFTEVGRNFLTVAGFTVVGLAAIFLGSRLVQRVANMTRLFWEPPLRRFERSIGMTLGGAIVVGIFGAVWLFFIVLAAADVLSGSYGEALGIAVALVGFFGFALWTLIGQKRKEYSDATSRAVAQAETRAT